MDRTAGGGGPRTGMRPPKLVYKCDVCGTEFVTRYPHKKKTCSVKCARKRQLTHCNDFNRRQHAADPKKYNAAVRENVQIRKAIEYIISDEVERLTPT